MRTRRRQPGLVVLGLMVLVLTTLAGPAFAHGGEASDEAAVLVRQAIALMVDSPDDLGEVEERVDAALEAPDTTGVDLAVLARADEALHDGDAVTARDLLEKSIGAGPVGSNDAPSPDAAGAVTGDAGGSGMDLATGAEPGDTLIMDPLEVQPRLTGTDWTLLALSLVLGLAGVWLVLRFRPQPAKDDR